MQKIKNVKKTEEKKLRKTLHKTLSATLKDYKNGWDEKKFGSTLKKASKILAGNFVKGVVKNNEKVKKEENNAVPVKAKSAAKSKNTPKTSNGAIAGTAINTAKIPKAGNAKKTSVPSKTDKAKRLKK